MWNQILEINTTLLGEVGDAGVLQDSQTITQVPVAPEDRFPKLLKVTFIPATEKHIPQSQKPPCASLTTAMTSPPLGWFNCLQQSNSCQRFPLIRIRASSLLQTSFRSVVKPLDHTRTAWLLRCDELLSVCLPHSKQLPFFYHVIPPYC